MADTRTFQGVTYTNGNLPKKLLAPLDGDNLDLANDRAVLRLDAAASWNRARAEVKAKTGIDLTVRGWNRTEAEQRTFYLQRHARWTPGHRVCCYWNGVPYRFTGAAHASPPGKSNHGWGLAVDVVDFGGVGNFNHPRRLASIAILKKHGWTDTEGRGSIKEPWHLVYDPAKDTQKNSTPQQEEPDMDATQARQLSEVHAFLTKPVIPDFDGNQTVKDALRRDLILSRRAVAQDAEAIAVAAVKAYAATTPGVDEAALTKGVVAEVRKTLASVEATEYVLTPKES